MISKQFVTAGNAVFTVAMPHAYAAEKRLGDHLTYRVRRSKDGKVLFVSYRKGASYDYIGILDPATAEIRFTAKSKLGPQNITVRVLRRVLVLLWLERGHEILESGFDVKHEGRCGRCARPLTVPASIESGIGPECAKAVFGVKPKAKPAPAAAPVPDDDGKWVSYANSLFD
jgi:hypothetical protein